MRWFGENWGASVCHSVEHAETPVGWLCARCGDAINIGNDGLILPLISRDGLDEIAYHLDCFLESIGVGKAHFRPK